MTLTWRDLSGRSSAAHAAAAASQRRRGAQVPADPHHRHPHPPLRIPHTSAARTIQRAPQPLAPRRFPRTPIAIAELAVPLGLWCGAIKRGKASPWVASATTSGCSISRSALRDDRRRRRRQPPEPGQARSSCEHSIATGNTLLFRVHPRMAISGDAIARQAGRQPAVVSSDGPELRWLMLLRPRPRHAANPQRFQPCLRVDAQDQRQGAEPAHRARPSRRTSSRRHERPGLRRCAPRNSPGGRRSTSSCPRSSGALTAGVDRHQHATATSSTCSSPRFGEDRNPVGSDWPNSDGVAPLDQAAVQDREGILRIESRASSRESHFWRNSIAAYKWIAGNPRSCRLTGD